MRCAGFLAMVALSSCTFSSEDAFFVDADAAFPIADGARFVWQAPDDDALNVTFRRDGAAYDVTERSHPDEPMTGVLLMAVPETPEDDYIVQWQAEPGDTSRAYAFMWPDGSGYRLYSEPSSFDLVLLVGVLAYWSDPRPLIRRAGSLVRPGGAVIAECTDASHPIAWLNRVYRATTSTFKTHRLTPETHSATNVATAFEQEGLRLARTFRYAYTVPLLSRLASQSTTYRAISRLYGTANSSRRQAWGPECLMLFERP